MSKFAKFFLAAVIFAVLATTGTYFIKQTRPLFLAALPPTAGCAVHSPPAGLQGTPAQTNRGFPAYYLQRVPILHVRDNGCRYVITYHTQFSWRHLLLDLAEWGLIALLVLYLINRLNGHYAVEVKKPQKAPKGKKTGGKRG